MNINSGFNVMFSGALAKSATAKASRQVRELTPSTTKPVQFGRIYPEEALVGLLLAGLAAVGVGATISTVKSHNEADEYKNDCLEKVAQTQDETCEISAITNGNVHIREFGIRHISSMTTISENQKADLFLTALRDGDDEVFKDAKEAIKVFIPTIQNPQLKSEMQTLKDKAPGFHWVSTGKSGYMKRNGYSKAYKAAEVNIKQIIAQQPG